MKNYNKKIIILLIVLPLCSCISHWQTKVVAFKNISKKNILVATFYNDNLNDSILLNEQFMTDTLIIGKTAIITLPNVILKAEPDSSKLFIRLLDYDIMKNAWKNSNSENLKKNSLIKSYVVQLNLINSKIDTIVIR